MLDLHFFQNPRFSAASAAIMLVFLALFGTIFLLTQYLQSVLGYSTVEAGAVLLPQAATIMIFAPLSNVWVQKFGNKLVVATGLSIVTTSLLLFETFEPSSSVLHVIAVTVLMGAGMANVLAPCTDSIMGSLPRAKAGVGSAVNDTTRQVGGAVGVAVLGSLLASHYSSKMTSHLSKVVPSGVLSQVTDNVGKAVGFANEAPAARPFHAQIIRAANDSFVGGMHLAFTVAAGITLVAAICTARFLPARPLADDDAPNRVEPDQRPVSATVPVA
jgi:Na+/melibiose symporter-like transporter